ncbi:uncharacterized protein LOC9644810 [Selaginella moellendorffii]|uniref:uncharacterized protein LOC9644810 n=1 Tax=Selaginella moellendorffii TaxID=88036 RepID=UPI000D1C4318|nr:uncharacterized protein LOC9644810 [Selaginella moellendorffii]|eukprot:XP_024521394.1 uncharacterized protein LOC9644810 [Selaginella moellendorffii]
MGGLCIGIIPPCIEEFKHPGGKTGVVISGRELHQQDLQVIQARLHNRHRWCGGTGNEIKCLGKLAPSIEKRGVGFGMFLLSRGLTLRQRGFVFLTSNAFIDFEFQRVLSAIGESLFHAIKTGTTTYSRTGEYSSVLIPW